MVREVKSYKAGFVVSDSTLTPEMTLGDVLDLKEKTGHSTMPVTDDGTSRGKLVGIVTSRDYRPSRDDRSKLVSEFMTPADKLITAAEDTTLKEANDLIWDNKLNTLPIVDKNGHLVSLVFRKDMIPTSLPQMSFLMTLSATWLALVLILVTMKPAFLCLLMQALMFYALTLLRVIPSGRSAHLSGFVQLTAIP